MNLIEKYYVFTLVFAVLTVSLFYFAADKDIVNLIIGAMIGLLTAPALLKGIN